MKRLFNFIKSSRKENNIEESTSMNNDANVEAKKMSEEVDNSYNELYRDDSDLGYC